MFFPTAFIRYVNAFMFVKDVHVSLYKYVVRTSLCTQYNIGQTYRTSNSDSSGLTYIEIFSSHMNVSMPTCLHVYFIWCIKYISYEGGTYWIVINVT